MYKKYQLNSENIFRKLQFNMFLRKSVRVVPTNYMRFRLKRNNPPFSQWKNSYELEQDMREINDKLKYYRNHPQPSANIDSIGGYRLYTPEEVNQYWGDLAVITTIVGAIYGLATDQFEWLIPGSFMIIIRPLIFINYSISVVFMHSQSRTFLYTTLLTVCTLWLIVKILQKL